MIAFILKFIKDEWVVIKQIPFEILTIFILTYVLNFYIAKWRYSKVIDLNNLLEKENTMLRIQKKIPNPLKPQELKKKLKHLSPEKQIFLKPYILQNTDTREVAGLDVDTGLALQNEGLIYKLLNVVYEKKSDSSYDAVVFHIHLETLLYLKKHPELISLNKKDTKNRGNV